MRHIPTRTYPRSPAGDKQRPRLWNRLTEPHSSLESAEARGQARLLASLCLPLPVLAIILPLLSSIGYSTIKPQTLPYVLIALAGAVSAYVLSRTRYYCFGVLSLVSGLFVFILGTIAVDPAPQAVQVLPLYLILAVFVASLVLDVRWTVVVSIVTMGSVLFVLPLLTSAATIDVIADHARFIGLMELLLITSAFLRQGQLRQLQKRTEAQETSEARYRNLFEASFEPMIIHHHGNIVEINPAAEALTGYTASELAGKGLATVIPSARDAGLFNPTPAAAPQSYPLEVRRHDGSMIITEVNAKAHQYQDETMQMMSIQDVTLQRKAEQQRLELALERAQIHILQRLIRNLSHDLRTPLAVIKTSVYLIERSLGDPVRHRKHLEVVREQTKRLQEIMDDVILLAQLDRAHQKTLDLKPVDADALLRNVVTGFEDEARKKNQQIRYIPHGALPMVQADAGALERACSNLIDNAINYTPEQGMITVTAEAENDSLEIAVSDTGIGIADSDLPHIFDHFYRSDAARSTGSGGAGLGLTVARKIIEMHEGSIRVESQVDHGSTFVISLPIELPEAQSVEAEEPLA